MATGIAFSVTVDFSLVEHALKGMERQIPFATSYAVNLTAKDAVNAMRAALPHHLKIRNSWTASGIRMRPSDKKKLEWSVGSIDDYMTDQIIPGERIPGEATSRGKGPSVAKSIAVPVGARRTKSGIVRRKEWPARLMAAYGKNHVGQGRQRAFIGKVRGHLGLWLAPVKAGKARLRLMWVFRKRLKFPARLPFRKIVEAEVRKRWPANAKKAVDHAIATAWK